MTDNPLLPFAYSIVTAVVTAVVTLWGRAKLADKNDETQARDLTRLELEHGKDLERLDVAHDRRLAEFKLEHAREVNELRAAWTANGLETRATLTRLTDSMNELTRRFDTFSVALIGLDGKNGLRGEVKTLRSEQTDLRDRVTALDFAQRLLARDAASDSDKE